METNSTTPTAKLPILNPGDFDLWLMRIEQYFLMTDYSLWEVILNGNKVLKKMVAEVEQTYEPTSVEEKQDMKNEMKARGTLLMALPNKDQIKFHQYKDAKLLMEAIKKRYQGNKESKKVQRTLLKQQYENFAALSSETIDQTFDRLQKLIGQLETQGEVIEQEDMNLKLLRSLPSEWKTHALIWRNKEEIETISLDDLYNNLKIYEPEITGSSNTSQNPQNVAFGDEEEMVFDVDADLQGEEVIVDEAQKVVEEVIEDISTAGNKEAISTAPQVTTAPITSVELTLAQTLVEVRNATKPKVKGISIQESSEATITITKTVQSLGKDKGKAILIEPERPMKRKAQIQANEELAQRLFAEEKAQLEKEQNEAKTIAE
ncbi:hypothetical protein Tco_0925504 [Tanacetum coccineum]|uniref:Uncharacterized protein n=1 Tax=Tanacetum coccineum TaxID=301880 RepID=A0ABQ5D723_9ASTR